MNFFDQSMWVWITSTIAAILLVVPSFRPLFGRSFQGAIHGISYLTALTLYTSLWVVGSKIVQTIIQTDFSNPLTAATAISLGSWTIGTAFLAFIIGFEAVGFLILNHKRGTLASS